MSYINSYKNQNWILPPSINQMIPENHICFFVEEFVENLNFSDFDMIYEGAGAPAYHPRILMKILLQGMLCGERSSRKIARACFENFVFMYLAEKVKPNFRTICRFRRQNSLFIKEAFKESIKLADSNQLLDLSMISIDGTTISANANKKKSLKREQVEKLDEIVDKMMEEDIEFDKIDEKMFDNEKNLSNMDKKDFRKIVSEYQRAKDKKKIQKQFSKVRGEVVKKEKLKKVSLTDPESRMMQNKKRIREFSYNAQLSVSKNQIIIANDICQDGHDVKQLIPQLEQVKENVELNRDEKYSADCGYSDGDNIKYAEDNWFDLYVPNQAQAQKFDGKDQTLNHDKYEYDEVRDELVIDGVRFKRSGGYVRKDGRQIATFYNKKLRKKKDVPLEFKSRLRMRDKMETSQGREVYALRKITVEPTIGHVKEVLGFRKFLLRGLDGAKIEFNLVSLSHNLKKIWLAKGRIKTNKDNCMKNINFCLIINFDYETGSAVIFFFLKEKTESRRLGGVHERADKRKFYKFKSSNNFNMNDTYLLRGVKPEEFAELKEQEADLVSSVMGGFNDVWKPKVQGVKTTFRYNQQRNAIGIYVERDGQQQLVVERQGLSEPEEAVVGSLYQTLEQRLDRLRLPKKSWVDSVSQ